MADAASPYAPGTVGDEPAEPRAPARPALFVAASFVMTLVGPGAIWLSWRTWLRATGIAAEETWWLELLGFAPSALSLLWGLLSDRWAIMDSRREGHLFCAALVAALAWLTFLILPYNVARLLAGCAIVAAHAIASVAIGGALAEIGRREGKSGRLAAAWSGSIAMAQLTAAALRPPAVSVPMAIGVCLTFAVIVAISMVVSLGTESAPAPANVAPRTPLRAYLRSATLWATVPVVMLAILGNPPYAAIASGEWPWPAKEIELCGRVAGACIYAFACRRLPFARAVRLALMVNVVATIALTDASGEKGNVLFVVVAALGVVEGFKFATLNTLFLRASPPGHEGFICALLTAAAQASWEASRLTRESFGSSVSGLSAVAAAAGAAALFASFLLPASLVARREGEGEAPSASAHGP